ncbi:MAG: bifunctional phosphopantothenoylcysteine decarboxylase/phosphopantothenate--cysteine ligase CoaBC [Candidatus Manganitrophaceae bacterium]|nr:MAG: bifunctional phosphopantothenoylcysteine decarboxylase/phosphopantothenate--cysteine ligase CoaBC [Candidatus Manganitrophaceae bacterium]
MLSGKKILLGITGSIAAYKSLQILRDLKSMGADVQVVTTAAARRFVPPLTLQVFSGRPVFTDLFDPHEEVIHLTLADEADLILIAPATAHFIAKMATGLADDLLGNLLLAASAPILIAPAMDIGMWNHPSVTENVALLQKRGVQIIEPEVGPLASGKEGKGRLANEKTIVEKVVSLLASESKLAGEVVLVTAGPTQEPIDPVRFISNRSSGKMGYALARVAREWGARVILISGPTSLPTPPGVERIDVRTAEEMKKEVEARYSEATLVLMAAAVGDYRPEAVSSQKIKKGNAARSIRLQETEDILAGLRSRKGKKVIVGFAAETEALLENARKKLSGKGLDLIVANDVTQEGAGFDVDTNIAQLIDSKGRIVPLPKMLKEDLARYILNEAVGIKKGVS